MASEILLSVGIDIGTSTTQLIFSELTLVNRASDYAVPRIEIVGRKIVYKSNIYFTPLKSQTEIDGAALKKIIEDEYRLAQIRPKDVDTGAVIITGETARKENAQMIVRQFSDFAGDFVVATAGPDLESILAGRGAGADKFSKENRCRVLNIDIGGGTSNLAVFNNGEPKDCGCLDIGGRLIKFDEVRRITYISEKVKTLIKRHGLRIFEGETASESEVSELTDILSGILEMSAGFAPQNEDYALMVTNHGLDIRRGQQTAALGAHTSGNMEDAADFSIDAVSFSGGVAEYIYRSEGIADFYKYGDIGLFLAQSIKRSKFMESGCRLFESSEKIRATVVGAGTHTTKLSGSTITVDEKLLPLKNIPVAKLEYLEEFFGDGSVNEEGIAQAAARKLGWFGEETAAIFISGLLNPSFLQVQSYGRALFKGFLTTGIKRPLVVIAGHDMAKVLGQTLWAMAGTKENIICLDGIELTSGDYIDIGRAAGGGCVVPVVVKTLVFHE